MNRLASANFVSSITSEKDRYNTRHEYDLNGNILITQRNGVIAVANGALPVFTYGEMDNLYYSYSGNRLMGVRDFAVSTQNLPDFNDRGSIGEDYEYDENGNLTKDLNKKIEKITYNDLNLPEVVDFGAKGKITYRYNAAGAKISKTITEGSKTKMINYEFGFIVQNDTLRECATPEGRVVFAPQPPAGGVSPSGLVPQFQYHYKDHLGNVRMTFAPDVPQVERIMLSAELDSAAKEERDFSNVTVVRTSEKALAG
jgi:hypothetical protein